MTAAFNRNLLARINRELDGDFDLRSFRHHALYNPTRGRVEMHLISAKRQIVTIGDTRIKFAEGEAIHTECSYKFTMTGFQALAARAGLQSRESWTDSNRWFTVHRLTAK